jgi:hypothetical protein
MAVAYYYETDHPDRVPPGDLLIQLGLRFQAGQVPPANELIATLQKRLNLPEIVTGIVTLWPEADSLAYLSVGYETSMAAVEALLPPGVALTGSDYHHTGLVGRVEAGRAAARRIAAWAQNNASP